MRKMKTMTLNLNEREMELLELMAAETDMDKTAVIRQAFRFYQSMHVRVTKFGHRCVFLDENGKNVTTMNDMFPMQYQPPQEQLNDK